jgi:hypothetical protein
MGEPRLRPARPFGPWPARGAPSRHAAAQASRPHAASLSRRSFRVPQSKHSAPRASSPCHSLCWRLWPHRACVTCACRRFKFDMRVYAAATCLDPLRLYVFPDGLARLATEPYSSDKADLRQGSCLRLPCDWLQCRCADCEVQWACHCGCRCQAVWLVLLPVGVMRHLGLGSAWALGRLAGAALSAVPLAARAAASAACTSPTTPSTRRAPSLLAARGSRAAARRRVSCEFVFLLCGCWVVGGAVSPAGRCIRGCRVRPLCRTPPATTMHHYAPLALDIFHNVLQPYQGVGRGARPATEPVSEEERFSKPHCGRCLRPVPESRNHKELNKDAWSWICNVCNEELRACGRQDRKAVWDCPTAAEGLRGCMCCCEPKQAPKALAQPSHSPSPHQPQWARASVLARFGLPRAGTAPAAPYVWGRAHGPRLGPAASRTRRGAAATETHTRLTAPLVVSCSLA